MDFVVVIPAVAGIIAVVLVTTMRVKRAEARRHLLHEERMAAIAKGVPIPEDIEIEGYGDLKLPGRDPALHGTILAALGLGMLAASRFVPRAQFGGEIQQVLGFLEVWAYPVTSVGIGLLVFALFTRRRMKP